MKKLPFVLSCLVVAVASSSAQITSVTTVANVEDMGFALEDTQFQFLRISPPTEEIYLHSFGRAFPFKAFNLKKKTINRLYAHMVTIDGMMFPIYTVYVQEDPKSRYRIVFNDKLRKIARIAPPVDYNPYAFMLNLFDVNDISEIDPLYRWIFDPAHIALKLDLIPEEFYEDYLAALEAERPEPPAPEPPQPVTSLQVQIAKTASGPRARVAWPEGFTDLIDVYSTTNLTEGAWKLVAVGLVASGETNLYPLEEGLLEDQSRYFTVGNGSVDTDGDFLPNGQEVYIYGTDPDNPDMDGDGILDGDETHADGTYGDLDEFFSDPFVADKTDYDDLPAPPPHGPDVDLSKLPKFEPEVVDREVVSGQPEISEWSRIGNPGDTMVLTGEKLSNTELKNPPEGDTEEIEEAIYGRDTRFLFFAHGERGRRYARGNILRLVEQQAAILLPQLPEDQMYLMWPYNESGYGAPVAINQTDVWWVGFDEVEPGGELNVYGRNLILGDGICRLYIEELDLWLESEADSNKYKATFMLPDTVPADTYTVYAHNGSGGAYGWSESKTIDVVEAFAWDGEIYNIVEDGGAIPNDGNDDQAAFDLVNDMAKNDTGSTVYFPEGTYNFSSRLGCNKNVRYVGAGMGKTIITTTDTREDIRLMEAFGDRVHVMDLSIHLTDQIEDQKALLFGFKSDIRFENVEIDDRQSSVFKHSILRLDDGKRTVLKGCRFYVTDSLVIGKARWLRMEDCEFIGFNDCNQMFTLKRARYIDVNGCDVRDDDPSDATKKDGWSKGRWLTAATSSLDVYVADNITHNIAPRQPEDFIRGLVPVAIDAWDSGAKLQRFYFDDVPDEFADRTGSLRMFMEIVNVENDEAQEKLWRVKEFDVENDFISVGIDDWQADWFKNGDELRCFVRDDVDRNSGEQILSEGLTTRFSEYVVESSGSTVQFSNSTGRLGDAENANVSMAHIVKGRGIGQTRVIESFDVDAGAVTLEKPWRVEPDSTSIINLGSFLDNFVIYGNQFDGRQDAVTNQTASAGFQPYGGSSSMIVDSNVFSDMRKGVAFYSNGSRDMDDNYSTMGQNFFNHVENNEFINCLYDIYLTTTESGGRPVYETDVSMVGNVFRRNRSKDAVGIAFYCETQAEYANPLVEMNVYDQNEVENPNQLISEGDGVAHQIWVLNKFRGKSGTGYPISEDHDPLLYRNSWEGFSSNYGGNTPGAIPEAPERAAEANGPLQQLSVLNTGTDPMHWLALEASPWLNFVENGTDTLVSNINSQVSVAGGLIPEEGEAATLSYEIDTENIEGMVNILLVANNQVRVISVNNEGSASSASSRTLYRDPDGADLAMRTRSFVYDDANAEVFFAGLPDQLFSIPQRDCWKGNNLLDVWDAFWLDRDDFGLYRDYFLANRDRWEELIDGCICCIDWDEFWPDRKALLDELVWVQWLEYWSTQNLCDCWGSLSAEVNWTRFRNYWRLPENLEKCSCWSAWDNWEIWKGFWEEYGVNRDLRQQCRNWEAWKACWKEFLVTRKVQDLTDDTEAWLTGTP